MTRAELVEKIADGIIHEEGFLLTPLQAKAQHIVWPCIAQRNFNLGNIRHWADANGKAYPRSYEYVDFLLKMGGDPRNALLESYRVLKLQIEFYIDGKLHGGKSPTLYEMFDKFAPTVDFNRPKQYAEHVAK